MSLNEHPYPARRTLVIHTRGSDREIGRQHGESVGDSATRGMVKFYYDFWKRLLATSSDHVVERSALAAAKFFIDPVLIRRLYSRIPEFMRERVRGVSETTELPFDQMITALVLPDLLPMLQAYLTRLRPRTFVNASPPLMACSSFVAVGDRFLHGRNLDFPGVSYWDRYPVIQSIARDGGLRYIGFTSAGVPLGGITGVNEAQVSVSLHQHYCKETSLGGALPFVIAEEILMTAKTLEDARAILSRAKVATSWAFIVTDGKSRDAFIYECHPKACGIRTLKNEGGLLAHSNFFQTAECRPREYATTARMNWDNYWRKTRLEELVKEAGRALTPERASAIVSDHYDRYWDEEKTINRTVSQVYNIQSLVLDPERMKVWFGEGDCPIQLRDYREFDLGEILAGRSGETETVYPSFRFKDQGKALAKETYILSFVAAFDGDFALALDRVLVSLAHDYAPEVGYVSAVLLMKLARYDEALAALRRAKTHIETKVAEKKKAKLPPEYFEISLYEARALDLVGRRDEARPLYRLIAGHGDLEDTNLRQLAANGGPYTTKQLSRVMMPYSTYIPFD